MLESRGVKLGAIGAGVSPNMPCRACKSEKLQKVDGELTASLPDLKSLEVPPIYVCQSVLICLDCGFAELAIPAQELQRLRKRETPSSS